MTVNFFSLALRVFFHRKSRDGLKHHTSIQNVMPTFLNRRRKFAPAPQPHRRMNVDRAQPAALQHLFPSGSRKLPCLRAGRFLLRYDPEFGAGLKDMGVGRHRNAFPIRKVSIRVLFHHVQPVVHDFVAAQIGEAFFYAASYAA